MKPKIIKCKTCSASFEARDPRKMYCSEKCNYLARKARRLAKSVRGTLRECEQCGQEFKMYSKRNRFCSSVCKDNYANAHRKLVSKTCKGCCVVFATAQPKQMYCTRSCALQHTEVVREFTCVDCGTRFSFTGRTRKHRCDACHKVYWNDYYADAQAGRGTTTWSRNPRYSRDKARLSAKERAGYRKIGLDAWGPACLCCGNRGVKHRAVDIHHVDGNLRNTAATNLIPLCRACHGKVHRRARRGSARTAVTSEMLQAALFELWPEGQQVIGIAAQQCADENAANSGNATV